MRSLHRWGRPTSCGALKVTSGHVVRWLAGELARCLHCGTLRKQTHGRGHATYSRDRGQTWGAIGGRCPPCQKGTS